MLTGNGQLKKYNMKIPAEISSKILTYRSISQQQATRKSQGSSYCLNLVQPLSSHSTLKETKELKTIFIKVLFI